MHNNVLSCSFLQLEFWAFSASYTDLTFVAQPQDTLLSVAESLTSHPADLLKSSTRLIKGATYPGLHTKGATEIYHQTVVVGPGICPTRAGPLDMQRQ